jgi:hypothetical protein
MTRKFLQTIIFLALVNSVYAFEVHLYSNKNEVFENEIAQIRLSTSQPIFTPDSESISITGGQITGLSKRNDLEYILFVKPEHSYQTIQIQVKSKNLKDLNNSVNELSSELISISIRSAGGPTQSTNNSLLVTQLQNNQSNTRRTSAKVFFTNFFGNLESVRNVTFGNMPSWGNSSPLLSNSLDKYVSNVNFGSSFLSQSQKAVEEENSEKTKGGVLIKQGVNSEIVKQNQEAAEFSPVEKISTQPVNWLEII